MSDGERMATYSTNSDVPDLGMYKRLGYFQPLPTTLHLWNQLAIAKATGNRNEVSKLSDQIRRMTIEAKRNGANEAHAVRA